VARQFLPLGSQTGILAPFLGGSWSPEFWVFLAVASFAFNQALEELFFRGYCQTRLTEAFGGPGAILIVTCFLTLAHDQYHNLTLGNVVSILSLVLVNAGIGMVFWRTGSLLPGVIVHGLTNLPTKGAYSYAMLTAVLIGIVAGRKQLADLLRQLFKGIAAIPAPLACLAGTILAVVAGIGFGRAPGAAAAIAAVGLAIAVGVAIRQRSRGGAALAVSPAR
jgi:hypothetical protein